MKKLLLILCLIAESVFGAYTLTYVSYSATETFVADFSGDPDSDVVIPSIADGGRTVAHISTGALNSPNIRTITANEGLEGIGDSGIGGTNIVSLSLPTTFSHIDDYGINCPALTNITFIGNAPSLGLEAFGVNPSARVNAYSYKSGWDNTFSGFPVYFMDLGGYNPVKHVLATRLDYGIFVPKISSTENLYTNMVLAINSQIPVINNLTTNATWLCWSSSSCIFTQRVTASQPTLITTGGVVTTYFDGADNIRGNVGDNLDFSSGKSFTINMWINAPTNQVTNDRILEWNMTPSLSPTNNSVQVFRLTSGVIWMQVTTNGTDRGISTAGVGVLSDDNLWHMITLTWNGAGTVNSFKNAVDGNSVSGGAGAETEGQFRISGVGSPYVGTVDDLRIFNRLLTVTEITNIYQQTKGRYGL